jgi:hypothetical protein
MDKLHGMLRAIRGETKSNADHVKVFRDFVAHLETLQKKTPRASPAKPQRVKAPRMTAKRRGK